MGPMRNLLPKIQEQVMANHKAGRGEKKKLLDRKRPSCSQATFATKTLKSCEPGVFRLIPARTRGWPGFSTLWIINRFSAQVWRGGDAWVREEVSSLSLSHLGGITFTFTFSSRWAQRLPGLSDGPHDWVYTDTQVMRRSRQRVFLRERERAHEGSRREWVSPHPSLLRNLTGGCWPSTISVQSTRRQFSRFPMQHLTNSGSSVTPINYFRVLKQRKNWQPCSQAMRWGDLESY